NSPGKLPGNDTGNAGFGRAPARISPHGSTALVSRHCPSCKPLWSRYHFGKPLVGSTRPTAARPFPSWANANPLVNTTKAMTAREIHHLNAQGFISPYLLIAMIWGLAMLWVVFRSR